MQSRSGDRSDDALDQIVHAPQARLIEPGRFFENGLAFVVLERADEDRRSPFDLSRRRDRGLRCAGPEARVLHHVAVKAAFVKIGQRLSLHDLLRVGLVDGDVFQLARLLLLFADSWFQGPFLLLLLFPLCLSFW